MVQEVFARFVADPVQNRDITDAEDARNGAKTDVAHCIEHRQRLHRRRLATRRRHGEIATA